MTAFTSLSITGACDICRQEFYMQLDGMDHKMAKQNVGHWIVHGHFCPGSPESNDLGVEWSETS